MFPESMQIMAEYMRTDYFSDWEIYLHARQLYIETGDLDAFDNMIRHVTMHDGPIPGEIVTIAWKDIVTEPMPVMPSDLKCY